MSCRNKRRYYVINENGTMFYGRLSKEEFGMICNVPWNKPYLFSTVKEAREIAGKYAGKVFYWPGFFYLNAVHDNQ